MPWLSPSERADYEHYATIKNVSRFDEHHWVHESHYNDFCQFKFKISELEAEVCPLAVSLDASDPAGTHCIMVGTIVVGFYSRDDADKYYEMLQWRRRSQIYRIVPHDPTLWVLSKE